MTQNDFVYLGEHLYQFSWKCYNFLCILLSWQPSWIFDKNKSKGLKQNFHFNTRPNSRLPKPMKKNLIDHLMVQTEFWRKFKIGAKVSNILSKLNLVYMVNNILLSLIYIIVFIYIVKKTFVIVFAIIVHTYVYQYM